MEHYKRMYKKKKKKKLLRTFFENCCPEPTAPVLADRVEMRWGPSAYDLDLYVLEYEGPEQDVYVYDEIYEYDTADNSYCLTSWFKDCPDTYLEMDMFSSPGPEIITWNANSKKYVILAKDYVDNPFIGSQVSQGSRDKEKLFFNGLVVKTEGGGQMAGHQTLNLKKKYRRPLTL